MTFGEAVRRVYHPSGLSPEYRSIIEDERERERNKWQEELTQWKTHFGECTYDQDGGRIYEESWSKSNPYTSAARWFYTNQELSALKARIVVSPSTVDAPMSFDDAMGFGGADGEL